MHVGGHKHWKNTRIQEQWWFIYKLTPFCFSLAFLGPLKEKTTDERKKMTEEKGNLNLTVKSV